jgi:hypothetical protein
VTGMAGDRSTEAVRSLSAAQSVHPELLSLSLLDDTALLVSVFKHKLFKIACVLQL